MDDALVQCRWCVGQQTNNRGYTRQSELIPQFLQGVLMLDARDDEPEQLGHTESNQQQGDHLATQAARP
jgi:hypothetical protein